MQGYDISPYFLGAGEFQLQINGAFVNWGDYIAAHTYSSLITGAGATVSLGVFDGDASNPGSPVANPGWYGDNSGNLSVSIYSCDPTTGMLTINKVASGGNGTFNFTSNIPGHASFSITTVGGAGSVTFAGVPVGTYAITEASQAGWTQSDAGDCPAVQVTPDGDNGCTITNTKNPKLGAIYGNKFLDWDGDASALESWWEPKLKGWTFYLDTNNNNQLDSGEPTSVTDNHGYYRFTSLPAGTYTVREVQQAGWTQTFPSSNFANDEYVINLGAGQVAKNKNFGNFKFGSVSGMKFNDKNGNGRKDANEPGLSGWTIKIKGPNGYSASTVTGSNGSYSFANLGPGTYTLSEVIPSTSPAWHQTLAPGKVKIVSGTTVVRQDFGNTQRKIKWGSYFDNPKFNWDFGGHH
jgi:uncharacterized protein (DUF2141 family)